MGKDGPSDSALAAARGWRLRRTAADRHAARCASRALCSGGAPRRYSPSVAGCVWVAGGCVFEPVALVHGLPITSWHELPVGVYGDLNAAVSKLFLDVGQR